MIVVICVMMIRLYQGKPVATVQASLAVAGDRDGSVVLHLAEFVLGVPIPESQWLICCNHLLLSLFCHAALPSATYKR